MMFIGYKISRASIIVRSIKYKLENINFFDLVAESEDDIVNIEKYVIYKNIYEFKN